MEPIKTFILSYKDFRVFYVSRSLYEKNNENERELKRFLMIAKPLFDVEFDLEIKIDDQSQKYKEKFKGTAEDLLKILN